MCPDSFNGEAIKKKHLLLHCPIYSFEVTVKINHPEG